MTRQEWRPAVEGFAAWLADSHRSTATCDGYLKHVAWLRDGSTTGPWEVTASELGAWLGRHSWSPSTRRKILVSIRLFYAWGVAEGLCEWAPTAGIPTSENRRRGPAKYPLPPAWAPAIEGFLTSLRAGARSEGTIEQRRWWLRRLAEVAPSPWTVTGDQLALWLSTPDWTAETKRVARATVRTFYAWAVRTGRIATSPAADLDAILVRRALPRPAPAAAIQAALASADDRTRLALLLGAMAGLRRAEIAALHTRDVQGDSILVRGKGGHERRVPLHPELQAQLTAEIVRRKRGTPGSGFSAERALPDGWLFPSDVIDRPMTPAHLGKLIAAALPMGWTAHTLRHRFASAAYAGQRDLRAVQELLGHSRPETTARYAAVPDGALVAAVAAVGL